MCDSAICVEKDWVRLRVAIETARRSTNHNEITENLSHVSLREKITHFVRAHLLTNKSVAMPRKTHSLTTYQSSWQLV